MMGLYFLALDSTQATAKKKTSSWAKLSPARNSTYQWVRNTHTIALVWPQVPTGDQGYLGDGEFPNHVLRILSHTLTQ